MDQTIETKNIEFIETELIQEMVHNRCFCEAGSREFVELDSTSFKSFPEYSNHCEQSCYYSGNVIVNFSGDPKNFPVIVKLLNSNLDDREGEQFQNEESFYSKTILEYHSRNYFVKCYLSDLGKYGKPALVWEDVESTQRYRRIGNSEILSLEHLKLCAKVLGEFHGGGLKLKCDNFEVFREVYKKLLPPSGLGKDNSNLAEFSLRTVNILKEHFTEDFEKKVIAKLGYDDPLKTITDILSRTNDVSTICHGNFIENNLLFKYNEEGVPIHLKLINWGTTRYCSPVVDLGPILFNHLPKENRLENVKLLFNVYINSIKKEVTDENICKQLIRDIVVNLHYVYLVLSFDHHRFSDEILVQCLSDLDLLGTFEDNPCCLI